MLLNLITYNILAQEKAIDYRFKGGEDGFFKFLSQNIKYPVLSMTNNSTGYSITGITISPEGKIIDISTVIKVDESIEKDIFNVLQMTKNKWLKCDTISINQTFYIQIIYVFKNHEELPEFVNINAKYNFLDPMIVTSLSWKTENFFDTNKHIATKLGKKLKENDFSEALRCVNELIRRNPLNIELYQVRKSIFGELNMNDFINKDMRKLQNFIPGVSLKELTNKN